MKSSNRRKAMKVGTKSVLFGVHAFWWHPITVALAWRRYHGQWPKHATEWAAIFCHDLGYWGMPNMDGPEGKEHPWRGGYLAARLFKKVPDQIAVMAHCWGHSRSFAKAHRFMLSPLCVPDKICVVYDPIWFYVLRATLSGEIHEFVANAPAPVRVNRFLWYRWYRSEVRKEYLS
jgi:hypothetical protein